MTHYVFYLPPCLCLCARSEQFICRFIKLKFRAISDASPAHFSENNFISLRCIYIENIQMSYTITDLLPQILAASQSGLLQQNN